jgi:hypothetical protein
MAREDNILQGINSGSGPPREGARPLHTRTGPQGRVQDLRRYKPDPWDGSRTSLCGVRATHSGVPGFRNTKNQDLIKARRGVWC